MKLLLGTFIMWGIGAPLYLPWLLARFGNYKGWYLVSFMPPLVWGRVMYMWPISAVFVCPSAFVALGIEGDDFLMAWAIASIMGIGLGVLMMIWTPRWAKPEWQLYLEDNYSYQEIRQVFIPAWRKMDRHEWSQLLDSESGIRKLVRIA